MQAYTVTSTGPVVENFLWTPTSEAKGGAGVPKLIK
jgi:hypothetical protein